jgi:chromosome segregation ATPase
LLVALLSAFFCGGPITPAWSLTQNERLESIERRLTDLTESLPAYVQKVSAFSSSATTSAAEAMLLRQQLSEQSAELVTLRSELEGWRQSSNESAGLVESLLQKVTGLENRLALLSTSFELTVSTWREAAEASARKARTWKGIAVLGVPGALVVGALAGAAIGRALK